MDQGGYEIRSPVAAGPDCPKGAYYAMAETIHPREALYLCMGSACHQMGVYDVLPRVQLWIERHALEDVLELKGSFCLGPCTDGIAMKFRDLTITNVNARNVEKRLDAEVLPEVRAGRVSGGGTDA